MSSDRPGRRRHRRHFFTCAKHAFAHASFYPFLDYMLARRVMRHRTPLIRYSKRVWPSLVALVARLVVSAVYTQARSLVSQTPCRVRLQRRRTASLLAAQASILLPTWSQCNATPARRRHRPCTFKVRSAMQPQSPMRRRQRRVRRMRSSARGARQTTTAYPTRVAKPFTETSGPTRTQQTTHNTKSDNKPEASHDAASSTKSSCAQVRPLRLMRVWRRRGAQLRLGWH